MFNKKADNLFYLYNMNLYPCKFLHINIFNIKSNIVRKSLFLYYILKAKILKVPFFM